MTCIFIYGKANRRIRIGKSAVCFYDPQKHLAIFCLLQHLNRFAVKNTSTPSSALECDLLFAARAEAGGVVLSCRNTDLVPASGTICMPRHFPLVIIEDILWHDFAVDKTFKVSGQHWHIFHPLYDRTLLFPLTLQSLATRNRPLQTN